MIGEYTKAEGSEEKLTRKSVGVFAGVYTLAILLFAAIQYLFDFDMKSADGVAALYVAGMLTGQFFVKKVKRLPEKEEVTKIKILSVIIALFLQLLLVSFVVSILSLAGDNTLASMIGSLPLVVVLIVLSVLTLFYYFLVGWSFKGGANAAFKNLSDNEKSETA